MIPLDEGAVAGEPAIPRKNLEWHKFSSFRSTSPIQVAHLFAGRGLTRNVVIRRRHSLTPLVRLFRLLHAPHAQTRPAQLHPHLVPVVPRTSRCTLLRLTPLRCPGKDHLDLGRRGSVHLFAVQLDELHERGEYTFESGVDRARSTDGELLSRRIAGLGRGHAGFLGVSLGSDDRGRSSISGW